MTNKFAVNNILSSETKKVIDIYDLWDLRIFFQETSVIQCSSRTWQVSANKCKEWNDSTKLKCIINRYWSP